MRDVQRLVRERVMEARVWTGAAASRRFDSDGAR